MKLLNSLPAWKNFERRGDHKCFRSLRRLKPLTAFNARMRYDQIRLSGLAALAASQAARNLAIACSRVAAVPCALIRRAPSLYFRRRGRGDWLRVLGWLITF